MSQTLRSAFEERVVAAVREGEPELVTLASDLVAFDTTARNLGDPPRQEAELQEHLRRAPRALGAEVEVWEPEPTGTAIAWCRTGWTSAGGRSSPRACARRRRVTPAQRPHRRRLGRAAGPVDEPPAPAGGPRRPALRPRQLRHEGRHRRHAVRARDRDPAGARLAGDVVFCTDTDEESSGAWRLRVRRPRRARRRRPVRRATAFDVWVACRGRRQPRWCAPSAAPGTPRCTTRTWRDGGPVNGDREDGGRARRACTSCARTGRAAPSPAQVPARARRAAHRDQGREWMVTYPSSCEAVLSVQYMPGRVDGDHGGQDVFDEVEAWVKAAADRDDWLAEHPPEWEWPCDIVRRRCGRRPDRDRHAGRRRRRRAARPHQRPRLVARRGVFTRRSPGPPTVSFGPGDLARAHTIDESVPVADLVDHAAAVALMLLRWCGGVE